MTISDIVRRYLGLQPGQPIRDAVITSTDQFIVTVDLRPILLALGGEWSQLVTSTEQAQQERRLNEKAYSAGAGIKIGEN